MGLTDLIYLARFFQNSNDNSAQKRIYTFCGSGLNPHILLKRSANGTCWCHNDRILEN